MEEAEILRAARQMIDLHGDGAESAAGHRADKLLNRGNVDGFHTWARVASAIADLRRKKQGRTELL